MKWLCGQSNHRAYKFYADHFIGREPFSFEITADIHREIFLMVCFYNGVHKNLHQINILITVCIPKLETRDQTIDVKSVQVWFEWKFQQQKIQ